MIVRRIDSIAPERWRNGGGITRTVAQSGGDWRVSIAEVERDGPYSRFDGIARISLVLRGQGVELRSGDDAIVLKPFEAVEYDGGADWHATLVDAPVTALNVMTRAGICRARVQAIVHPVVIGPGCAAIVVAHESACLCDALPIAAGETGVIECVTQPVRLEATRGTPFLVTIECVTDPIQR
ncbi:HutD/Ves family protein [Burkholderia multivorans]|uniref:HutD/Ves family protein n=1 Tax=Burkholderia multivorans TaxID=87883 RepID=UPI00201A0E65|nr:HutD family protein [Burkholderia multivorans]MCA8143534.1 HutD family protein [Burkholderia multivorans]MCO1368544.1 HutD family protein [Burkholderia multivorans]MCO1380435.1 HutD family protein [Burkholderia multivorans]UQP21454.1 HutD family protein [Burkholderia multivorans]UQP92099.1 HutD family protein [Burkholderia multivorans]